MAKPFLTLRAPLPGDPYGISRGTAHDRLRGENAHEVHVMGMKRGGQHAVVNWIFGLAPGTSYYLNNIVYANAKGFVGVGHGQWFQKRMAGGSLSAVMRNDGQSVDRSEVRIDPDGAEPMGCPVERVLRMHNGEATAIPELQLPSRRSLFLWVLEDADLTTLDEVPDERFRRGQSHRFSQVVVLRDPYNWLASRMLSDEVRNASEETVSRWKLMAREALGRTNALRRRGPVVFVNYNRWFQEREYREEIADQLGYRLSDMGINTVSQEGGGSSLDGREYDGKAQLMRVNDRWRLVADRPDFKHWMNDRELQDLSRELFGFVPHESGHIVQVRAGAVRADTPTVPVAPRPTVSILPTSRIETYRSSDDPTFVGHNRAELTVVGMKRGGQQAITNWLFGLARGTSFHLNGASFASADGFVGVSYGRRFRSEIATGTLCAVVENDGEKLVRKAARLDAESLEPLRDPLERVLRMATKERTAWRALGVPKSRQLYVWGIQDADLPRADDIPWQAIRRGRSTRRVAVMVLRDPYNWIASRILSERVDSPCPAMIERYIRLAEAFKTGRSPIADHVDQVVWIRYNHWFKDPAYRATMARRLGFEPSDIGIHRVSPEGGGSSVDGLEYDGRAQEMKVLERWREVADFPAYKNFFKKRPELVSLSEELFCFRPF